MKVCTGCGATKALESFQKRHDTKDGLQHKCRDCRSQQTKKSYWANPELAKLERRKRTDEYRENNVENLVISGIKTCSRCKEVKDVSLFKRNRSTRDGRVHTCKSCNRIEWLKRKYKLSLEDYNILLAKQGFRCAICNYEFTEERISVVDHNHTTEVIRGLLCQTCNRGIGLLKDNIAVLEQAIIYLQEGEQ